MVRIFLWIGLQGKSKSRLEYTSVGQPCRLVISSIYGEGLTCDHVMITTYQPVTISTRSMVALGEMLVVSTENVY